MIFILVYPSGDEKDRVIYIADKRVKLAWAIWLSLLKKEKEGHLLPITRHFS